MPRAERPQMADYGVPEDPEGLLDWSWASERLERNRNYWVVTASPDARPHAMPVWGVWLPEAEQFVFSAADSARKVRNLRANPQITVTTDDTVEVVVVEGTAAEVRSTERPDVVRSWAAKYGAEEHEADPGASEAQLAEFLADVALFVVTPERAFSIIERPEDFGPRATRWVW